MQGPDLPSLGNKFKIGKMRIKRFSKKEAIRFAWTTTKNNFGFLIGVSVASLLISILPVLFEALVKGTSSTIAFIIYYIGSVVLGGMIEMGFTKISLKFYDKQKASFSDLFSCLHLLAKYIIGYILYLSLIIIGLVLLIIPGIIWAMKFYFFVYFIVDKGLGPVQALKRSSAITKDAKWDLFLFNLLLVGIVLLGLLSLLVGIFVALPIITLATAFVYRMLQAQSEIIQAAQSQ